MDIDNPNEERDQGAENSSAPRTRTVVGIGASAGGLAALKRFFEHVPSDSDLAFVVVVHLSPEHKSHLADLLQPAVRFPVQQVTETVPLDVNNVYVIPPNANLSAIDTHLRLSKLEEQRRERAPIDHFFRTLANTHDVHAIGVILTGTGSDGTLGLKQIKAKGGLIIVQDPNEAEFDGMPQSAIATGLVDRVLPVAEIPQALLRFARTEPRVQVVEDSKDVEHTDGVLLAKILAILRTRTDRDFSRYKSATILRRIARRMQLNYVEDLERYIDMLREQQEEARALADDLLITVTSFFRDPEVFHKLEEEVIPRLFEGKGLQDTLRVWSVGCATGEEAYSIAILLLEYASRQDSPPQILVFASDLHKRSLDAARDGVYPGDIATDVGQERLERFFQKENGGYRVRKEVRDAVVFAPHNLLGDPPFSRVHLIMCRNLLIYLERSVQSDVVGLFHYALSPDGSLVLGSAETIDGSNLFRTEDKKLCLYRKRNVPAPEPRLPVFPLTRLRVAAEQTPKSEAIPGAALYSAVHQNLLERYAPPSILIGPDNKLVHLSEHAGRYLIHPGGDVTTSILKLVREELRGELLSLLQSIRETKEPLDSRPVPVRFNGRPRSVVMHARPATDPDQDGFVLIMFIEQHQNDATGENNGRRGRPIETGGDDKRINELEAELNVLRQHLQAVIEEYETTQEEMKAANEEMQSSNEELRSTMEELETSKEELQSINEELQTVNQENRHKVEELSQLSGDLQNLLTATDIATLFLDRNLRILRFTPRVAELFSVRVTDRGRPISDLTHRLGYEQLRTDAETVLNRLVPVDREIQDDSGRWYLTRVLPYRSAEDRIEGVVITFIDITTQKSAEFALRDSEERLSSELEAMNNLRGVVSRLIRNPELPTALQDILDCSMEITHAPMGLVQLLDSLSGNLQIFAQRGFRQDSSGAGSACLSPAVARALQEKRRVIIEDIEKEPSSVPLEAAGMAGYRAVQSTPLISATGRVIGVFSTYYACPHTFTERDFRILDLYTRQAADFVDRREAMEALVRSEERFRGALEIDNVGVVFFGEGGAITWANEAFLRLAGYSRQDVEAGALRWDVLTPPEWISESARATEEYKNTGSIRPYEREYFRRNGARWFGLFAATRLTNDEGVGFVIDISDRKRAEQALWETEQKFHTIANLVPDLLWRTEPNGRTSWYNQRCYDYTGRTAQDDEEFVWTDLIHPDDRGAWHSSYSETFHIGQPLRRELRIRGGNGDYRWFLVQIQPYYDSNGKLARWFGAATDVHEERVTTGALRRSLVEKEELLKEVHHRVKNNLQIITSLLSLQSQQIQDQKALALFEEARNRVQSIASIHEVMYRSEYFAAIELGTYARRLVPEVVRLYDGAERIEVEIVGGSVSLELQRAVPFGLLLNELIANACKHAFPSGRRGALTVRLVNEDSTIVLTVADTGVGLPKGFKQERVESLGIYLVKSLARQLGATVTFESNRGGTKVVVQLPVKLPLDTTHTQ